MKIFHIPAFTDNYIWCIQKNNKLAVVDPGDSKELLNLIKDNDLIFYKWNRTLEYIVSASTFKDYDRDKYLSYYKDSIPYIDGGCIITKKSILQNVPLNENIAWGEAEDVEWSKRLFLNGYLIEVSKDSIAFTETTKTSKFFLKLHPKIRYVLRRIIHPIKVIWWKIS